MCVLKEIPIITLDLWCTRLLASLVYRYGQKVTLIKNWSVICLGKVVNLPFSKKFFFLFWFKLCISLTTALTNMKLGREIKLCDMTNIVMVKIMYFLEKHKKQSRPIHS